MTQDQLIAAMKSWHTLNKAVVGFDEADCKTAISMELAKGKRKDIAVRIHQKLCALRATRERNELLATLTDTPVFLIGTTFSEK